MTGALLMTVSAGNSSAVAGSIVPISACAWNDIYGEDAGSTQAVTISGITGPIQIAASRTGLGVLSVIINGVYSAYTGPFLVRPGDTLAWAISLSGRVDRAGVVTVTNASAGSAISNFNYSVYSSRDGRA